MQSVWGQRGGPWEFNLRDIFRWCDLLHKNQVSICVINKILFSFMNLFLFMFHEIVYVYI